MRAGRPWKATRSPASAIQRARPSSSGNSSSTGLVGGGDVGGIARERDPAERALALAEERADVGGHEAGVRRRRRRSRRARPRRASDVAVVEDLGAGVEEADHRRAVRGHRGARPAHVARRDRRGADVGRLLERGRSARSSAGRVRCVWSVTMSAAKPRASSSGSDLGGVADQTDRQRRRARPCAALAARAPRRRGVGHLVEVARLEATLDPRARRRRRTARRRRSSSPRAAARRPCRRVRRSA